MNNKSFYMHPRYDEFTAFLKTLQTEAKITPGTKHLAFDVWLALSELQDHVNELLDPQNARFQNLILVNENMILKAQLNTLQDMNTALNESNNILKQAFNKVSE